MEVTRFVPPNPLPVVKLPAQVAAEKAAVEAAQRRTALKIGIGASLTLAFLVWWVSR